MRNTKKSADNFHDDFGDRSVASKSKHVAIFIEAISVKFAEASARTVDVSVWIRKSQTKKASLVAKESFQKTPEGLSLNGLVNCECFLSVHDTILISIREKSSTWKTSKTTKTGMIYEEAFELIEANPGEPKVDYLLLSSHDVRITFAKESDFNRLRGAQAMTDLASKHKPLLSRLGKSADYIEYILENAGSFVMGHIELTVILTALRAINKVLLEWKQMHISIVGLVERIVSTAEHIIEAQKVASLPKLKKTIQDTWELFDKARQLVFNFIQKENTIKMLVPSITIRMSKHIKELQVLFDNVIKGFDRGLAIQTLQTVEKVNTTVHDIYKNGEKLDKKLDRLGNVIFNNVLEKLLRHGIHYEVPVETSPQGAQLNILRKVMTWVQESGSLQNILVLPEIPGEDDLAISSAVVQFLSSKKLLSSFFFFDSDVPQKTAAVCVRRIAYDLAKRPGSIQDKISSVLTAHPHFLEATSTAEIYQGLVHESLSSHYPDTNSINDPFVVVIGAADECTSPADRTALLTIFQCWKKLPSRCKLIISGCENNDPEKIRPQKRRRTLQIAKNNSTSDPPHPRKESNFDEKTHVVHHIIQQSGTSVAFNAVFGDNSSKFHAPKQATLHESECTNTSSHISVIKIGHILESEPTVPCSSAATDASSQVTKNTQHPRMDGPLSHPVCPPDPTSSSSVIPPLRETTKKDYANSELFLAPKSLAIGPTPTSEADRSINSSASPFSEPSLQESAEDSQVNSGTVCKSTSTLAFSSLIPDAGAGNSRLAMSKGLLSTFASPAIFSSSPFSSSHALVMSILGQNAPFATRILLYGAGRENIPSIRDAIAYLGGDAFMKVRSRFAWSADDCPDSDSDEDEEGSEDQLNENQPSSDEADCASSTTDTTANLSSDAAESDQQVFGSFAFSTFRSSAPTPAVDSSYNRPTLSGKLHRIVGDTLVEGTNKASGVCTGLLHYSSLVRSHLNAVSEGLGENDEETNSRDTVIDDGTAGDNKFPLQTQTQTRTLLPGSQSKDTSTDANTSSGVRIQDFNDDFFGQTVATSHPTRKNSWLSNVQTAKERLTEGLIDTRPVVRDSVMGIAASATAWGTNSFASLQRSGVSSTWRSGWPGKG